MSYLYKLPLSVNYSYVGLIAITESDPRYVLMEFSLWFDDEVDGLGMRLGEVFMQVLHVHGIKSTCWQAVDNQSFGRHFSSASPTST